MRYPAALPAIALGAGISIGIWLHFSPHPLVLVLIWLTAVVCFSAVATCRSSSVSLSALLPPVCSTALEPMHMRAQRHFSRSLRSMQTVMSTMFVNIAGRLRTDAVTRTRGRHLKR